MPLNPQKKFREFDAALGRIVASKRIRAGLSQSELATRTGMPLSNLGRVEKGTRSLTVAELETIAEIVKVPAGEMAEEAVDLYGGVDKLMSEAQGTNDELATKRAQKEAAQLTPEELESLDHPKAAQRRDAETSSPEPDTP